MQLSQGDVEHLLAELRIAGATNPSPALTTLLTELHDRATGNARINLSGIEELNWEIISHLSTADALNLFSVNHYLDALGSNDNYWHQRIEQYFKVSLRGIQCQPRQQISQFPGRSAVKYAYGRLRKPEHVEVMIQELYYPLIERYCDKAAAGSPCSARSFAGWCGR